MGESQQLSDDELKKFMNPNRINKIIQIRALGVILFWIILVSLFYYNWRLGLIQLGFFISEIMIKIR